MLGCAGLSLSSFSSQTSAGFLHGSGRVAAAFLGDEVPECVLEKRSVRMHAHDACVDGCMHACIQGWLESSCLLSEFHTAYPAPTPPIREDCC